MLRILSQIKLNIDEGNLEGCLKRLCVGRRKLVTCRSDLSVGLESTILNGESVVFDGGSLVPIFSSLEPVYGSSVFSRDQWSKDAICIL